MLRALIVLMVAGAAALPLAAQPRPLVVASTPDMAAIVRSVGGELVDLQVIMPAGADVHSFTIGSAQVDSLQQAALIVLANSLDLGFEATVKAAVGRRPILDWPDYAARGAALRDYPGYPKNPHGPWLHLDNARAMGQAIAEKLIALGLPRAAVEANAQAFSRELTALGGDYVALARDHNLDRPLLAVIPGLCDLIANTGLPVGAVLMAEGSGTVSGQQLADAVAKLKSGAYGGIVCPRSMERSKQGEAARQVAADAGMAVTYVRFQDTDLQTDTYLSVSAYNAAALAGLSHPRGRTSPPPLHLGASLPVSLTAPAALLIGLLIGLTIARRRPPVRGAGIFDHKDE